MSKPLIPRNGAAIVDSAGRASREFHIFLLSLADAAGVDMSAELDDILRRIDALEGAGQSAAIRAVGSLVARDGILSLIGDVDNPSGNSYYGSNASGERGWWQVIDAVAAGTGLNKEVSTDGYNVLGELDDASQLPAASDINDAYLIDGDYWVWTGAAWDRAGPPSGEAVLSLAELPNAGGGVLQKIVRDNYGRVAGTSSAAISDLSDVDATAASAGQVLTKQSDGKWRGQSPSGGGGGAMTFIGDVITTGSQAIVSFTGVSNGYRNLVVHYRARGTAAAASVTLRARFNGDTGNNYAFYKRNRFGNVQSDNVGYIEFADIAATTAAAGTSDSGCMNVADYRGTTFFKTSSSIGTTYAGAGPGAITDFTGGGWWKSTAAINAIDIFPASGAFADGSVFSLYALQ